MLIPKNVFKLSKCAKSGLSQYAIEGVYFSRNREGQPVAVATDGCKLVAATWAEPPLAEFPSLPGGFDATPRPDLAVVVPSDACKKAVKLGGTRKSTKPILNNVVMAESSIVMAESSINGRVPLLATDLTTTYRLDPVPVEGCFPSWRDVFPNYLQTSAVRLRLRHLREMVETMESVVGKGEDASVTIAMNAANGQPDPCSKEPDRVVTSPVVFTVKTPDMTVGGLLMPLSGPIDTWTP